MTQDRPFFGILLMLAFCTIVPISDAIAKLLGESVPLLIVILARFSISLISLLPYCWWAGISLRPPKGKRLVIWARSLLHLLGIGTMFTALQYLPLADAIAIAFVMPFISLLLGHFVLGEAVGPHRIGACVVGFVGTLFVIQPNFAEVGWPALLPLSTALVFALFMLMTRQVAKEVDPIALQTIGGAQSMLLMIPAFLVFPPMEGFLAITGWEWSLLLIMGLIGTFAHLLMTWSLRFAPSATLAPMQYVEIPISTFVGYLVFKDLPNGLAALGICISIAAGLYIILRERRLSADQSKLSEA